MKSITLYINLKINSKPHLLEYMQINGGGSHHNYVSTKDIETLCFMCLVDDD